MSTPYASATSASFNVPSLVDEAEGDVAEGDRFDDVAEGDAAAAAMTVGDMANCTIGDGDAAEGDTPAGGIPADGIPAGDTADGEGPAADAAGLFDSEVRTRLCCPTPVSRRCEIEVACVGIVSSSICTSSSWAIPSSRATFSQEDMVVGNAIELGDSELPGLGLFETPFAGGDRLLDGVGVKSICSANVVLLLLPSS